MTTPDPDSLQQRLQELIDEHHVPGAGLAVLDGDDIVEVAAGVINKNTGIEATPDTLFQIGSITKVWTATLVMMAVDEGTLDLDEPVVTYLPEFKVADPGVTKSVTLRHFLSHSSGIGGDHILETGRGDDTLARYVETCVDIGQEHDLGATMSYCNTGYSVSGRILEKVTGKVWDQILRERLLDPLGLTHTNTLPEEALLFRTAAGHIKPPGADAYQVAPIWMLPRSAGPAGLINARPSDVLRFAQLHLNEGRAPDGTQLLSPGAVKQMQEPQIDVPDRYSLGDKWGIGWILFNWSGRRLYGHDGNTVGQSAFLRVAPDARVAVCLLTNGGEAKAVYRAIYRDLFKDLADIEVPGYPTAPETPVELDLAPYEGAFKRLNVDLELVRNDEGGLTGTIRTSGAVAKIVSSEEERKQTMKLVPVDRELFLATTDATPTPSPVVFFDFDGDTPKRMHFGARAMTRR